MENAHLSIVRYLSFTMARNPRDYSDNRCLPFFVSCTYDCGCRHMTVQDEYNLVINPRIRPRYVTNSDEPAKLLSLFVMSYKIVKEQIRHFVENQNYTNWHYGNFCKAKDTLVEDFGLIPTVAFWVFPPLGNRYLRADFDDEKDEVTDGEGINKDKHDFDIFIDGKLLRSASF